MNNGDLSPADQQLLAIMLEADALISGLDETQVKQAMAGDYSVFPLLFPQMQDCVGRLLGFLQEERTELERKHKECAAKGISCAECGLSAADWKVVWEQEDGGWKLVCACREEIASGSVKSDD